MHHLVTCSKVSGKGRVAFVMASLYCSQLQQCTAFAFTPPARVVSEGAWETPMSSTRLAEQHRHRPSIAGAGVHVPISSRGGPCMSAWSTTAAAMSARTGQKRQIGKLRVPEASRPAAAAEESSMTKDRDEQEGFQWTRQWYPVGVMRDLEARDPRQPYPVKLLGEALVVWKDPTDGGWKTFADRCPHRWAPLSEGRVDQKSGRLQCIYHGWEFQGDGKCGSIPQADPKARETAQSSKRACATVIPTKVLEGKLWLWPDSSPEGMKESEVVQPVTVPGLDVDGGDFGGNWYMRELSYGFDTLVENLADPAHVPFAHHGVMGSRAMGTPMKMEIDKKAGSGKDSFVTNRTGYAGSTVMRVGFAAPALVYYESDYTETLGTVAKRLPLRFRALFWMMKTLKLDKRMSMKLRSCVYPLAGSYDIDQDEDRKKKSDRLLSYFIGYAVPTSPGKSKIFTRTARNFFLQHPVIPRRFRNSLAKEHLNQHLVLDGDSMALHVQERLLADAGHHGVDQPERTYFMPTASDATIRAFRTWFHSRGGAGVPWAQGVDATNLGPVLPREVVLDRMDGHTKDCAACGKAFRVSGKVKQLSAGATVLLVSAAAAVPRGLLPVGLVIGALSSTGLAVAMSKRQQAFIFEDYVHAQRDG